MAQGMMGNSVGPINTMSLDHFGKRLATGSADCVRIWDVETNQMQDELRKHEGAVWAVTWAHPMYGPILASAGEDKRTIIWNEADNCWVATHQYDAQGAVMAAVFGPWEYGLQLAIASSDGHLAVLSHHDDVLVPAERWSVEKFQAHDGGVFAVCWATATSPTILNDMEATYNIELEPRRLVTGGADKQVRIWRHDVHTGQWAEQHHFPPGEHTDWVRDVAWRPNMGIPANTIASCAEDGTVVIWEQAMSGQQWRKQQQWNLDASAWQLSWSATGSILAVSTSSNQVLLYKESLHGWESVDVSDKTEAEASLQEPFLLSSFDPPAEESGERHEERTDRAQEAVTSGETILERSRMSPTLASIAPDGRNSLAELEKTPEK